jgi:uncharacterized protein YfaS (alpha-2-macroglobulin family)
MASEDDAFLFHDLRFILVGDFNRIDPGLEAFSIREMKAHWGGRRNDSTGAVSAAAPVDLKPTLKFELVIEEPEAFMPGKNNQNWCRHRGLVLGFSSNGKDTFQATYDSNIFVLPRRLPANSNCTLMVKAGFRLCDRQLKKDYTTIFRTGKIVYPNECVPVWGKEYNHFATRTIDGGFYSENNADGGAESEVNEDAENENEAGKTEENESNEPDSSRSFIPMVNLFPESPSVPIKRFGSSRIVCGVRSIGTREIVSPRRPGRFPKASWKFDTLAPPPAGVNWYEYIPLRLAPALSREGRGIADVMLSVNKAPFDTLGRYQTTDLGAQLMRGRLATAVSMVSLTRGTPIAGASVACIGRKGTMLAKGTTGADGLFRIDRHISPEFIVAAFCGDTLVYKTEASDRDKSFDTLQCRGDIITDREFYRIGDTVFFKGIVRRLMDRWEPMGPDSAVVTIAWMGAKPFIDTLPLTGCGAFSGFCVVPHDVGRLSYEISSKLVHCRIKFSGALKVADFRPLELSAEVGKSFIDGKTLNFPVFAKWLHGGATGFGNISWTCDFNREGAQYPSDAFRWKYRWKGGNSRKASGSTYLDKTGRAVIDVPYLPEDSGSTCRFSIIVSGSSLQSVEAKGEAAIPLSHQLRLGFQQSQDGSKNDTVLLRFRAVRENGDTCKAMELRTDIFRHEAVKRTVKNRCSLPAYVRDTLHSLFRTDFPSTDSLGIAPLQMASMPAGYYTVTVRPKDGLPTDTFTYDFFIHKPDTGRRDPWTAVHHKDERDTFTLAEKDTGILHEAGDTVRLRLTSSRDSCRVLIIVSRENLYEHQWISMTGRDTSVPLIVKNLFIPVVKVQASFFPPVRRNSRGLAIIPEGLIADRSIDLRISEASRRIPVRLATDRASYAPGDSVTLRCTVPFKFRSASALVMVVDEGELMRSSAQLPNINETFSMEEVDADHFKTEWSIHHLRGPFDYDSLNGLRQCPRHWVAGIGFGAGYGSGFGGGGDDIIGGLLGGGGESSLGLRAQAHSVVALRTPPRPCAYFNPRMSFNDSGSATCRFTLPGNLTRWRVTAVVDDTTAFGEDTMTFTARKPLMIRPQLPRFLRLGDSASGVYIVENRSDTDRIVASAVVMKGDTARDRIKLSADETHECRFPLVGRAVGEDSLLFLTRCNALGDGIKVCLPVISERPRDVAAIGGSTTDGVKIPVVLPDPGKIDGGSLELSLATTRMQNLREGARYLFEYPYDCLEQRGASIMPLLLLKDFAARFDLPMLAKGNEKKTIQKYLDHIVEFQNDSSGGLRYWPERYEEPSPWLTAFTLEIMMKAKAAGYAIDDRVFSRALKYLLREMKRKGSDGRKLFIDSYTLLVAAEAGKPDRSALKKLYKEEASLPFPGRVDLLKAMHIAGGCKKRVAELQNKLLAGLIEKDRLAYVAAENAKGLEFCHESQVRLTALTLEALLETGSKSRFDEPMIRWLTEQRRAGRWRTTQENVAVFRAFSAYTKVYENDMPKLSAVVRLAGSDWFRAALEGREGASAAASKPLDSIAAKGATEVAIDRTGSGRLYYDVLLNTFPKGPVRPTSSGFIVRRTVSGFDLSEKTPSERARLRVGDLVKVELSIECDQTVGFVAINDPIPAGCEAVNPELNGGEQKMARENTEWSGPAVLSHKEFRDSRVLLFADELPVGRYVFSYVLKPTAAGIFSWPAPFAEAMYYPEIYGRGAESVVTIEDF